MAIIEITTRLDRRWFERKTKSELISMLMANLDKVDIFAEEYRTELAKARKERDELQETLTAVEHEVAIVYDHITNGRISKCNTDARTVIAVADDCNNEVINEVVRLELAAATKVIKAARCIRHWHETQDGGMIVSGPHVHKLWEALEAYDRATTPKES